MTINPEGNRRLMGVDRNGRVAATVAPPSDVRVRLVRWGADGRAEFLPIPPTDRPGYGGTGETLGAVAADGTVYGIVGRIFSGAYSGIAHEIVAYRGGYWHHVVPKCDADGEAILDAVDGDRLGITFESPNLIDFDRVASGWYSPYAVILNGDGSCHVIGRANVRAIRGPFAAGFRGYLGATPAPTNVNVLQQRFLAVRWYHKKLRLLGPGVAYDVAADGTAVGADAPAGLDSTVYAGDSSGSHTYHCCNPHAVLWDPTGNSVNMAPGAKRSVAYAIDDHDSVIGMEQEPDGKHFAFMWRHGKLHRLDDLVDAPGWRFESAYAFAADGGIVGIGTYHGVATAFVVSL